MPQEDWSDYASPTGPHTRQVDMSGWLPIKSAPRDGTVILVLGGTYITECQRGGPLDFPLAVFYDTEGGGYQDCEWSHAVDHYYGIGAKPTHWQPLPAPPENGS